MNRFLTTSGGSGLLAALCWLLPMFLPLLAPLQLLVPLPLLLIALRQGERVGLVAGMVPLLLAIVVTGNLLGSLITFLFLCGVPLLLARLLLGGWKVSQCLSFGYIVTAALLFLGMVAVAMMGIDMVSALERSLEQRIAPTRELFVAALAKNEGVSLRNVALFKEELQQMVTLMARIFPVVGLGGWFLVLSGNLLLVRRLLMKNRDTFQMVPEDLLTFRAPFFLVWPLIGSAMLALYATGNWRFMGLNLGLFLALPSLFQGLAVVQWSMRKLGVSSWLQGIYYTFLLLWTQVILAVTVIGLLDNWFDFRNRYLHGTEGKNSSGE
ncbi:MAG: DUF2232 domain-containing protein [Magnetococcales bacterium]|nr:DUF2232 domain-containing protein [Magnetococcales bacterium]